MPARSGLMGALPDCRRPTPRARRPGIAALLAALAPALAAAGCNIPGPEGADCVDDSGCDETERLGCWQGTCQRLSPVDGPLAFEVIPRTAEGLGPVALVPEPAGRVELSVCPPGEVAGDVELPAAHPLDIEATATTAVPGLTRRLTTTLPADPAAPDPRPFALTLPPATWQLRFTSRDGESPPLFATVEVAGCAPVPDLHVSPPARYTREIPIRFGPGPLGRCGAAVQALDPATRVPLTAEAVVQGDGARCPDARLTAWIDDVDRVLDLVLRVRPAPGGGAVASQELPFRSHPGAGGLCPPDAGPPCPAAATVDLLPPDGDGPTYLAPVTVTAVDEGGLPVGTVERVSAVGLLDGVPRVCDPADPERCGWGQGPVPATFRATEAGPGPAVDMPLLLPGRYGFTVVPTAASDFAITSVPLAPVAAGTPVRVTLARKLWTTGLVDFEGEPLRALVRAEPIDGRGRTALAETGDDGRYGLALDPGRYRLEVRPRDMGRRVPWGSVELPEAALGGTFDVALPPRARVQGRVRSAGSPVAGAVVRVFRCEPDCAAAGATARAVGEAITEGDGSFAVLVPGL